MRYSSSSVGEKIKNARIDMGLTQQQLTEKLNNLLPSHEILERTMVSRWEKGLHFPKKTRQIALEKILKIKIGLPPKRVNSIASYMPYQEQIHERLMYGLKDCRELWITSANSYSGVWQNLSSLNNIFENLRNKSDCLVKEIYYIQTLDDIKKVKQLAISKYPCYRLSVRIAPGQPLPILHIPNKKIGIILSGFGDDLRNVGLELDGSLASFSEHTFRYRWVYSTVVVDESGKIEHKNIQHLTNLMRELGGSINKYISPTL